MSKSPPPAFLLMALLATGCLAPTARDLSVDLDFGPERVEVRGVFHDLRLSRDDELLAFRQVMLLEDHAGLDLAGLGTVQTWRALDRDGGLDLELAGSVPRATVDAALAWKAGQSKPPGEGLWVFRPEGKGLTFFVTQLVSVYEFPPGFVPRMKEVRGAFTYRLVSQAGRNEGPSALATWRAVQADPESSKRLAHWMKDAERAFIAWDEPDSENVVDAKPPMPLADTFLFRKRLELLREALIDSGANELPAPPETELLGRIGQRTPLLEKPLPKREARSLERAYRAALGEPSRSERHLQSGCRGLTSRDGKALCRLLTPRARAPRPRAP